MTARDAYAKTSKSSAAQDNPVGVRSAQEAMEAAEDAHRDDAGSDQERTAAYIATRKAELATAQAEESHARQDREKAELAYQSQLEGQLASRQQELEAMQAAADKAKAERLGWRKKGNDLVITMSGISFDTGGHTLTPDAKKRLDVIAHTVKEYKDRSVSIAGYTDDKGQEDANLKLSQQRADTVRAYLEKQGVEPSRIVTEGRGEANPAASNDTPEGRASNRRVEITMRPAGEAPERQLVKGVDPAPADKNP